VQSKKSKDKNGTVLYIDRNVQLALHVITVGELISADRNFGISFSPHTGGTEQKEQAQLKLLKRKKRVA
jgi:hypothetical protein